MNEDLDGEPIGVLEQRNLMQSNWQEYHSHSVHFKKTLRMLPHVERVP